MGVRINTEKDHDALAEVPEDIRYASKVAEKAPDEPWALVHNAEVFPIDKRRMTSDSLLAQATMSCRVAKNDLGTTVPKIDDLWKRVKDGTYWRVLMVDVLSFGNEYRLHCSQVRYQKR